MKYSHIIIGILAFVFVWSPSWAQPVLRRHYPLNSCSTAEVASGFNGVFFGLGQGYPDRFGNTDGATKFFANAKITTPSFFSDFDYKSGYTISFWMYIDENLSKRHGKAPWLDTDPIIRVFYGTDSSNTPLTSVYRRADRLVLERHTTNVAKQTKNWGLWVWDPVNFTERTGWYQVIISQETSRGSVYIFYPNGQMESCAHYFGLQDIGNVKNWGFANNGSPLIIDDFKIYQGAVDELIARQMYGQSAPPHGMYRISLCADNKQQVHPSGHSTAISTPLEILPNDLPNDRSVYKWVFAPVSGKPGVYMIRMVYEDVYMHLANHRADESNRVELLDFSDAKYAIYYEWYLEPTEDGYFYIKSNADRSKFLHTVGHSSSASTRLEILSFSQERASLYKWRLNLIKTDYEIQKGPGIIPGVSYNFVQSLNTFIGLIPLTPVTSDATPVRSDRGPYPSLLTYWRFHRQIDDCYRLYNASLQEFNLHPEAHSVSPGTELEAYKFSSGHSDSYQFVLEKKNKYGRRYVLRHALNQRLGVFGGEGWFGNYVGLETKEPNEWALYRSESPNANKQLYYIKPGIYRITSLADEHKSITPRDYGWSTTTDLVLKPTSGDRYTSQYWVLDYERDKAGQPILDGAYTVQLFGTDKYFMHTKAHKIWDGAKLELYHLGRENLPSLKWFIWPTRDGSGAYYMVSAGATKMQVHLENNSTAENTPIEVWIGNPSIQEPSFRWKFESVSVISPNVEGEFKIVSQKDQSQCIHVKGHSASPSAKLELFPFHAPYANTFKWKFIKNADNTYFIQNVNSGLYIHPSGHSTANSTKLEQLDYDSAYAPYYKWIVMPGTRVGGTYLIVSVANPNMYIHLAGHAASTSNEIELYPYDSQHPDAYEWKIE